MVSYRAGRLYTPENSFGAFDTITSTSLHYGVAKKFWERNREQRKILEIFSPEDTHGVIAHTDLLNDGNKNLWAIERELTLGKDQPYLHLPNPESFEERLLMLTDDQKNAVKEIMGEGFEFQKNVPFNTFLNDGESSSTSNILRNKLSLMLNKDILTADNIGIKLQDLLTNGAIFVDTEYKGGSLGKTNSDDVIDINTGTIKYHADNYNDSYGDYGHALLDTVLHEMTHVLMMHKERQNYQNNNIPTELGIDNFEIPQQLLGYTSNFVAEYEAQYVSSQVLNRLGIEAGKKSQQRMAAFKHLIENKGYGDQIQYELLDNLVDEMLSNITVIGDITEELSTQFDMASAGVTSIQVSEDMRPILSKIQAFDKDMILYQGNNLDSKKDEVKQVLSDMETDMELLWSSGVFDKELIYNMVAQKYAPYIETLDNVNVNQFLKHAAPKFKKITPNLIAEMFLDANTDKYVKNFVKNDLNEILNPLIKEEKTNDPNKRLRQTLSGYKEVPLNDFSLLLPLHSAEPVVNSNGKYNQGYMNKFIFNRPKDVTTGPLGIRNILDSDIVQGLDLAQKVQVAKAILDEEMYTSVSDLMSVDKKLSGAMGWLVVNTDTGVTCMNRMTNGICEFAEACYAFLGTIRPAGLKKQLAKMMFYSELGPEELANEISQRGGKVVRINQEGEFNSINDFLKISKVAELLPDVRFYGYTKNQDVLKEIIQNGLPKNLVINDSLGQTHGAQYMSVPQGQIIDFLEAGYLLCKGACATCEQCLNDIKKVTILRDGSQTLGVEDVAHLNLKGQKVVFQTLKEYEEAGIQVTEALTQEIIADVSAVSGMVRQNQVTFANKGETKQTTLDPFMTQTKAAEFSMPGLVENTGYIKYRNEMRKQQERERAKHSMPGFSSQAYVDFQNKYGEQVNYLLMNKWDKARYKLNQDGQDHKIMNKGIDTAEWLTNTIQAQSSKAYQHSQEYAKEHGSKNLEFVQGKMGNIIGVTEQFKDTLSGLAEVFPILTPAVEGLNIALQAEQLISTGLGAAIDILNFARTGETESTFLQTMANWANSESALQAAAGQMVLTGVTWLASAAEAVLAFIRGLGTGTLLILAAAILAVVAAVELLKFWENKHAEALKESQKALEEATAKNNVALSQYKDLKKARENETNAIKRQQAARKEAIALYELEASRLKKRKAVQDEAKLRNDAVWGEYGIRASLQKMGLGFIAGGDFQSQYKNYDGTTANIRQVKESTLGNLFASSEQRYVASVYDKNSAFFAEVEAYKDPLQALYDKESQLIEQYGSIDLARGTKEFEDAVQEFADATGLNGETAGKMLDWLETENRVNQATQAMKAQVNVITAKANAKALSAEVEDTPLLDDNHTLEQAMIMAQAQDIYKEAYDYMWWEKFQADLFGILWTIIDHMFFWDGADNATKYWKKSEAYEEGMNELTELGVRGVYDIGNEMAENSDRRDYGAGPSAYSDSPFGAALESAELMEAEYSQQMALERRYTMDETQKFQKELNEGMIQTGQSGVEGFKTGLDQHSPGAISRSMGDEMLYTQEAIQQNYNMLMLESRQIGEDSVVSFKDGLGQDPEGNISKSVNDEMIYTQEALENNREPIKELSYDIGYESGEQYGQGFMDGLKSLYEQISTPEALTQSLEDRILVRQGYGVPEGANPNDPEVQAEQTERRAKTESKLFARSGVGSILINAGKREGKAALRVAAKEGVNWQNASVVGRVVNSAEIAASDGLKAGAKALFAPKKASNIPTGKVAGTVDDTLKGARKYGSKALGKLGIDTSVDMGAKALGWVARNFGDDAAKGAARLVRGAGKALPFIGTAMTAAFSIAEHNPFEKHYNEDGSEKRAFQSTGEVAGSIAGSLAADVISIGAGPLAGMLAGFVLEPLGEAIGGTIGWLTDEVVNTKFTDAWAGFNDALGGIPNQIVGFIDQSPIGQAGHFVFNQLDNLTGGWLGETWDKVQNSSIMELPGVIGEQLWSGATGLWDSLTGGNNQEQQNLPDIGEKMPNVPQSNTGTQSTIIIKNININTEDDPEKIKSALMNLIIEMQEQVSPRQVSRTVGKPPAQSTSTTQNENNTPEAEGTDTQSGAQNGDQNNNPTT